MRSEEFKQHVLSERPIVRLIGGASMAFYRIAKSVPGGRSSFFAHIEAEDASEAMHLARLSNADCNLEVWRSHYLVAVVPRDRPPYLVEGKGAALEQAERNHVPASRSIPKAPTSEA